jgi:hypothetical protein
MKKIVAMALLGAGTVNAHAVGTAVGTIVTVDTRKDGYFLVAVSSPSSGAPACATDVVRMSGNATTPGGKAILAMAMAAQLAGRQVHLEGSGSCVEYSQIESIGRILSR